MKAEKVLKTKKTNFSDEIKEKDIDVGMDNLKPDNKNKSKTLFIISSILILIMFILIISNIAGYTE